MWVGKPITRLAVKRHIGIVEVRAAEEIALAYYSLDGWVLDPSRTYEKVDRKSHISYDRASILDVCNRYKDWMRTWKGNQEALSVIINVIVLETPLAKVAKHLGVRYGTAKRTVIALLRDYAVRASWVSVSVLHDWRREAETGPTGLNILLRPRERRVKA
jgi:hypothetical protein